MNTNIVTTFSEINAINNHKDLIGALGKKCLIVCSMNSAKKSGALKDVKAALEKFDIHYSIFDEIKQNPTVTSCIEAGKAAFQYKADFLIGIGGGSPLDATKIAAVVATNTSINEDQLYDQAWTNDPIPFILVGTTAGTGSEVTNVSVLTDKNGRKRSIKNDALYAKYSFGDPRYTETMPVNIQVSTAVDTLAHLLESYFSNKANDESREYSINGIIKLYPYIKLLNKDSMLNINQRKDIYDASILGGKAIDITGTTYCHSVGYYFTENYNITHGFACALFLNSLIDYELKNNKEYARELFRRININPEEMKKEVKETIIHIRIKLFNQDLQRLRIRYYENSGLKNTYQNMPLDELMDILKEQFN